MCVCGRERMTKRERESRVENGRRGEGKEIVELAIY